METEQEPLEGEKDHKPNRITNTLFILNCALLLAILFVCLALYLRKKEIPQPEVLGKEYIQVMEREDISAAEEKLRDPLPSFGSAESEEWTETDPSMVWKYLSDLDFMIAGDSRVVAFESFGFMDENHVIASHGANISLIWGTYDRLEMINPVILVLNFGINDIRWSMDSSGFLVNLEEVMDTLNQRLPNSYIYVQSIFPVTEVGIESYPNLVVLEEWNQDIRNACESHGWRYLDLNYLIEEYPELYDQDGVHFAPEFYDYWAQGIWNRFLEDSGM